MSPNGDSIALVSTPSADQPTHAADSTILKNPVLPIVNVDAANDVLDVPGDSAFVRSEPHEVAPFPVVLNHTVQQYVDAFAEQPAGIDASFQRSRPYIPQMVKVMEGNGLPSDLVYLSFAESSFSSKGAGPWQLTKATARRFHLIVNRDIDERRDPLKSTQAAAGYLATLHNEIGDWHVALVGWNKGESALDQYWALRGVKYDRLLAHLPSYTRSLLNRFMAVAIIAHHARSYGIAPIDYSQPASFRWLEIKGGTSLAAVAHELGVSLGELRELNPALLHDRIPSSLEGYRIRVPLQTGA